MRKILVTNDSQDKTGYDYVCNTIADAVNLIQGETDIEIDKGVYTYSTLAGMTSKTSQTQTVTWHGHRKDTTIVILYNLVTHNPRCPVIFREMIIMPDNDFKKPSNASGTQEQRGIWYSNCNTLCKWHNVLFLKSKNGKYPTDSFIMTYGTTPMPDSRNKYFYNCMFDSGIKTARTPAYLENCIQIKQNDSDTFMINDTYDSKIKRINCYADYVDENYIPLNYKDIGLYNPVGNAFAWELAVDEPSIELPADKTYSKIIKDITFKKLNKFLVHFTITR